MRTAITRTAVLLSLFLGGCNNASAHESAAKEAVSSLEQINATLDTVKDEASAKAAAAKLETMMPKFKDLQTRMQGMDKAKPTAAEEAKMAPTMQQFTAQLGKMSENMARISADPKMSGPINSAMEKM